MRYTFYIKLALLIIPVLVLFFIPFLDEESNLIGGGNYDLTKLYSGIFILVTIAVWFSLIMLNSAFFYYKKNKRGLKENNPLLLIAIFSFLIFLLIFMFTWFT